MGSPFLDQMKKHASSFIHERYKDARLFFNDITEAEILAEKVTNNEPCSPDARTMTRIAEASYALEDYWRIVDVLHRRLYTVDWKQWRKSYKSLVLLDFLLTHGPEEFAAEFDEDICVIEELGSFKHTDEKGIDWGLNMQKISKRVLELLKGGETLMQARLKAIKTSKEILGFGNLCISSSSSPSSVSSSGSSVFVLDSATGSSSGTCSSLTWSERDVQSEDELSPWIEENRNGKDSCTRTEVRDIPLRRRKEDEDMNRFHLWDSSFDQETGSLMEVEEEEEEREGRKGKGKYSGSLMRGLCSKLGISPRGNAKNYGFAKHGEMGKKKINRPFFSVR